MRAARLGHRLESLEVVVDSVSDDRGILGIDSSTPAGPLSSRVRVRLSAPGVGADELRALARWAVDHCPVSDAVRRAVPLTVEVEVG
jgi:organic hydroperoxide reductase OsmC/OhrA